jgi:hypothetical protein
MVWLGMHRPLLILELLLGGVLVLLIREASASLLQLQLHNLQINPLLRRRPSRSLGRFFARYRTGAGTDQ